MLSIWDLNVLGVENWSEGGGSRPAEHVDDFVLFGCGFAVL